LTKEDVRDLSRIADLKGLEQLIEILPSKVGSPLSINSIREDLGYHHGTITTWIEILSRLYLIFTIRPWHRNIVRSIKKEKKLFFFDWSLLEDSGSRFENLVAVALLRMAARFTEMGLGAFELMYVRDKEKREVDFIIREGSDLIAMNVTYTNDVSKREIEGLLEFKERYKNAELVMLTKELEQTDNNKVKYIPLWKWLTKKI